jgi:rhodanese-related sulfurtransferase
MKIVDHSALKALMMNHDPIEVIDVRSKNEFAAGHIPGARSLPFDELTAPRIFERLRPTKQVICIVSDRGQVRAGLATGIFRSAGSLNAVPLVGGMKDWMDRGLPVRRKRLSATPRDYLRASALPVIAAATAAALHEFVVTTLLLAIAGVLLLTLKSPRRKRARQTSRIGRKHVMKSFFWPRDAVLLQGEAL